MIFLFKLGSDATPGLSILFEICTTSKRLRCQITGDNYLLCYQIMKLFMLFAIDNLIILCNEGWGIGEPFLPAKLSFTLLLYTLDEYIRFKPYTKTSH